MSQDKADDKELDYRHQSGGNIQTKETNDEKMGFNTIQDDEDLPSDNEEELLKEVNDELDGNIKLPKDVRGYDDIKESQQSA